ncbi:MAG TPA: carbamoyltransferase [Oligoflexia bacterium]|nr:carbamoyltransferase [Oligoflexia bacterium]HMP27468.1 carbamoyltransferase [Oligoflexia bacterium]
MNILGLSAFYHDSAACLVQNGKIVAAAQEERFTRKKHDPNFPAQASAYCLREGGITVDQLDYVVFYDKPLLKFERLLQTYLHTAPSGFTSYAKAMPLWLKHKLWIPDTIKNELGYKGEVLFTEHHQSHAASAFYPSPFEAAAILTIDGVGEWTTNSMGVGRGSSLEIFKEIKFPHSLGLLYSAMTYFTGFKVNSGEYKVMGLAPYGEPKYSSRIFDNLIDLKEDGSYHLNLEYFDFMAGLTMTNDKFAKLFDGPRRKPEELLTQREMDLARSIQEVVEEVMLRQARAIHRETGLENLCMAGGVALNCVGNGRVLREGPFKNIWIQPAAGDAGGALGAALCCWHGLLGKPRRLENNGRDLQRASLLGPEFSNEEALQQLAQFGAVYRRMEGDQVFKEIARNLSAEKVIGLFQGRMEFGPRALGSRSIIGDPRSPTMQSKMNLKIKYRESFRPFAPAVLREKVSEYFELDCDSPYMLLVAPVKSERRIPMSEEQKNLFGIAKLNVPKSDVPAITHVDYSARIQTVDSNESPIFYKVIKEFYDQTGCPVVVNTSFNVRGEPIVCTPADAYKCFMRTEIDLLVINDLVLYKEEQPKWNEKEVWQEKFELD